MSFHASTASFRAGEAGVAIQLPPSLCKENLDCFAPLAMRVLVFHESKPVPPRKRMFFFEKKNQKTFAPLETGFGSAEGLNLQKFFASFFQKRSAFFL
jgi:hypothetical protein